jgi:hypothetical protein
VLKDNFSIGIPIGKATTKEAVRAKLKLADVKILTLSTILDVVTGAS